MLSLASARRAARALRRRSRALGGRLGCPEWAPARLAHRPLLGGVDGLHHRLPIGRVEALAGFPQLHHKPLGLRAAQDSLKRDLQAQLRVRQITAERAPTLRGTPNEVGKLRRFDTRMR